MRRPLSLAVVLACVLLVGGCVSVPSVPSAAPPPVPSVDAAAALTPSAPPATQASARTALVATTPVHRTAKRRTDRRAAPRHLSDATGRERSRAIPHAQRPHAAVRSAPTRPAAPRARHRGTAPTVPDHRPTRPHTGRPASTYDLRTVCGWARQAPAAAGAATLCDSYVR
ncbi:hypothetical protein QA811_30820 [Streptomyces sp. B21-102]|uniref:hypothetical protein n=1 Tax=Streptomyces sp. B21-102 TaxID=3039416 RepID=UPI002FF1D3B4